MQCHYASCRSRKEDAALNRKRKLVDKQAVCCPGMDQTWLEDRAERLLALGSPLNQNVEEWLNDRDFSEVLIRGKYSLTTVLALRDSRDIADALLSLESFRLTPETEFLLWRERR